jgi:putative methyltransferase
MQENLYFFQFGSLYDGEAYLPYSTGLLWAYAKTDPIIANRYQNRGFRFVRTNPDEIVAGLDAPAVAAFSTYVWNWEMSREVARRIRARYPGCLIVFGGPQVPNDMTGFFHAHPFIDVAVHGEGEVTFAELLREHAGGQKYARIPGLTYNDGRGGVAAPEKRERVADLAVLPSPYLTGVFDELFATLPYRWQAVWETNRGCPYQCTFCDWGSAIATRLRSFPLDRLAAEIEFFGQRAITFIFGADANFGILERDLDLARLLADTKARLGYPGKFRGNYAKNSTDRVTQIAKLLNREGLDKGITLSVQSMDEVTLRNIKRKNMKVTSLSRFLREYRQSNITAYSEVLIGLPGETYDSFKQGIDILLDNGVHHSIYLYRTILLPNCELNDPAYKALHEIRSIRSPTALEHCRPSGETVQEYEETIIGTKTMPTEDWVRSLLFSWAVQAFHALNLTQVVAIALRALQGTAYSELYERLIQFGEENPKTLVGAELQATRNKLQEVLGGGNWDIFVPEFSDLMWPSEEASYLRISAELPRFYEELGEFLEGDLEPELLQSLLAFQQAMVVKWAGDGSGAWISPYGWLTFYRSHLEGDPQPLRKGRFEVVIRDALRFDGDRRRYSNEIVFWGRRLGKTTYQDVTEAELSFDETIDLHHADVRDVAVPDLGRRLLPLV